MADTSDTLAFERGKRTRRLSVDHSAHLPNPTSSADLLEKVASESNPLERVRFH
jgi:hypothetical protein